MPQQDVSRNPPSQVYTPQSYQQEQPSPSHDKQFLNAKTVSKAEEIRNGVEKTAGLLDTSQVILEENKSHLKEAGEKVKIL